MKSKPTFLVRGNYLIYKLTPESGDNIIVHGINVNDKTTDVKVPISYTRCIQHDFYVNGKPVEFDLALMSSKQDNFVAKSQRHTDPETQAFIAYQNANFSPDTAFRCSSMVVLIYRIIEEGLSIYHDKIGEIASELFVNVDNLSSNGSVRRNPLQLKISMYYAMYVFYLSEGETLKSDEIKNDFLKLLSDLDPEGYIAPSVFNIVKFLSLCAIDISISNSDISKYSEQCWKFIGLSVCGLSPASSIHHLDEFSRAYGDFLQLSALSKILNGEIATYRGKDANKIKSEIIESCIRFSSTPKLDQIKKNYQINI